MRAVHSSGTRQHPLDGMLALTIAAPLCFALNSTQPVPCAVGTTVTVRNLFASLPVRLKVQRESLTSEARKVHNIVIAYALAHPTLRLQLHQPPRPPLRKLPVADTAVRERRMRNLSAAVDSSFNNNQGAIVCLFGAAQLAQLCRVRYSSSEHDGIAPSENVAIDGYVARPLPGTLTFFFVFHVMFYM